MPEVTVIVPNYNHAAYLSLRLESIFNQTFRDFDVIILDDCSTDNSIDILNKYSGNEKVSQFIINSKNEGNTFKQWVKGINLAKGRYIWIAESDDFCDFVFIENLLPQLRNGVGVVFCESNHVDSNGGVLLKHEKIHNHEIYDGVDFIQDKMIYGNAIYNASMAIFEKDLFNLIDQTSFTKMKYCGDWLFWSLLAEKTKISKVYYPYNNFRRHSTSVSSRSEMNGLHILEGVKVLSHNKNYLDIKEMRTVNNFWIDKIEHSRVNIKYLFLILIFLSKNHPRMFKMWTGRNFNRVFNYLYIIPITSRIKKIFSSKDLR